MFVTIPSVEPGPSTPASESYANLLKLEKTFRAHNARGNRFRAAYHYGRLRVAVDEHIRRFGAPADW